MTELALVNLLALPLGLGLLGFVEPCSVGSSLSFIRYLERKSARARMAQVTVFALTRALFMGLLGRAAALVGAAFIGAQKGAWIVLGGAYILIGALYASGQLGFLMRPIGPSLTQFSGAQGSAALGLVFGLNIPACAAPLIFALLGSAAAGGADAAPARGFVSLAVFGLALSAPLVAAVAWPPARRLLDRLTVFSRRVPVVTGLVLVALGLWSVAFGLFVNLEEWV